MIISDPTVPERYATALLNVARRQNIREILLEETTEFLDVVASNLKARIVFEAPQFSMETKIGFLDKTIKGRFHPVIERLVYLLLEKRRVEYLGQILRRFKILIEKDLGILDAEVTSAVELSTNQKAALHQKMEAYLNSKLTINYIVDPAVLGGLRFRCGDLLIEDTVAWRLESVRRALEDAARRVELV